MTSKQENFLKGIKIVMSEDPEFGIERQWDKFLEIIDDLNPESMQETILPDKASHYKEIKEMLKGFTRLETGWHFGEGIAADMEAIATITGLLDVLGGKDYPMAVFSGINGEIQLMISNENTIWEFTVESNKTITFGKEQRATGEEIEYIENLSISEARVFMEKFLAEN